MSSQFNLIEEDWIPCITKDGEFKEIGIREALINPYAYIEIIDESPLVTAGIYRLLLAILYRILEIDSISKLPRIWDDGLPVRQINRYLEQWKNRFYLVDDTYPFYQLAGIRMKEGKSVPINVLVMEAASGNNKTLFDHSIDGEFYCTAPEAARNLIAAQGYAFCGTCNKSIFIDNMEKSDKNYSTSILVSGGLIWVSGNTLAQTLVLNLNPIEISEDDIPIWEVDEPKKVINLTAVNGVLDLFTFQSRIILLLPENESNSLLFKKMVYTQGRKYENISFDLMMAYQRRYDKKGNDLGFYPVFISEDRSTWRNSNSLFVQESDLHKPPQAFSTISRLRNDELLNPKMKLTVNIAGICSDKAKPLLWRHDKIPVLASIFDDASKSELLGDLLEISNKIANKLNSSIYSLCKKYLESENKPADENDVKKLKKHISLIDSYWFSLESKFYEILVHLDETNEDDIITEWGKFCLITSLRILDESKTMLGNSPRAIIAQAQARIIIDKDDELLSNLMNEIKQKGVSN
jgi:CRISPR system Cascade subunit CasA